MKKFNKINNIAGWIVFAIAAVVYIATIEPTASFWDCSEFIATAFKLEVGHPPGAPLFMLVGKLVTLFAGSNLQAVPVTINVYSALVSAFTILFLFWTITHLARKITGAKDELTVTQLIAIIGSGTVGALAYTFSDSFWFSAVEGEVYASSSLFTALVFWAILKWENVADEKYANRWIILIAYLMGLSIGVHLLNLLAIPAIVMIYYFKKYPVTRKGVITAFILSVVMLATIMYGIIQGTFAIASWFELLFVNGFGLPYESGFIFFVVLLIAVIIWGLWYTSKKGKVIANTIVLALAVILLGYSSYASIIIRSQANPPLDENDPETLFDLLSYLNREQYGDRPLIYGPVYNAPILSSKEGKPIYAAKNGKYVAINHRQDYVYDDKFNMLFPRMYSREGSHVKAYKEWANVKGTPIASTNQQGEPETIYKPTGWENLKFFIRYQVDFMYIRYFMWNFSGRQNDMLSYGGILKGNWISGIPFIDEMFLGPQDKIPNTIKNNKARNTYFMLPLLLGLIGLFYHLMKQKNDFWVVMLLFFMTGLAIVLYLNQTPYQPRERDYAYTGSFYAFAIWIGLGVMGLIEFVRKKIPGTPAAILVTILTLGLVPGIMAQQNWDDHDRSGRYTCRDFAYDYLNTCAPNAIIFTNGDNDTFPLWYLQEVENVRTDVRVINLSYLGADWYIEQMQRRTYDSKPIPFSMKQEQYQTGTRDVVYVIDKVGDYEDLTKIMDFVASDDPRTKTIPNARERVDWMPANKFYLNIDSSKVLNNNVLSDKFKKSIVKQMRWELKNKNALYKNDMMVMDLIAHNDWTRPIYFAITVSDENYMGLERYFQLQGLAYRLVPVEAKTRADGQIGGVDSKILYDNIMNKFRWGNLSDPKVYLDENNLRMLSNIRNTFSRLSEQLINENKTDSAVKVLDRCFQVMPTNQVPLNYWALPLIEQYYRAKQFDKANAYVTQLYLNYDNELKYFFRMKGSFKDQVDYEKRLNMQVLNELVNITNKYGQKELSGKISTIFQNDINAYGPVQGQ